MDDPLTSMLERIGLFGSSVLIGLACFPVFRFFDNFFPSHVKLELTRRLRMAPSMPWAHIFIHMHDRVFVGPSTTSTGRPGFWRTVCVSFTCWIVLFVGFSLSSTTVRNDIVALFELSEEFAIPNLVTLVSLFSLFFWLNPIVDYLSVFETRIVLQRMRTANRIRSLSLLLFVDLVFTSMITVICFSAVIWAQFVFFQFIFQEELMKSGYGDVELNLEDMFEFVRSVFMFQDSVSYLAPYFFTTFVTSIWIWFYFLADTIFRLVPYFQSSFPIVQKPFQSIGLIISLLAGGAYFLAGTISPVIT